MNDSDALQGLWRIQSSTLRGDPVGGAATHYLIAGNSMKEICPDWVDEGKLRTTFVLDETAWPKRLTKTLVYNGPDGRPDRNPIILRYLYHLDGDSLSLCSGPYGAFPDDISDEYAIETLVRDHGPIPAQRQPSGTPPLVDDLLGTLEWDDNLNWYRGHLKILQFSFDLSLRPDQGTDASNALSRAKQIVRNFDGYRQLAANFAVAGLLDLKNDIWLHEGENEISAGEFIAKMTLEAITVECDGDVAFWHHDGDLFWGHSIQVCIDANDKCTSTDIPG